MKLCVPTMDDAGLAARISAHFGSAPYFAVVDTGSEAVEVVSNAHAHHEHGSCDPLSLLSNRHVDAVVCHGLGRRAWARLDAVGIPVFVTNGVDVAAAASGFESGSLQRLTYDVACQGGRGHASE